MKKTGKNATRFLAAALVSLLLLFTVQQREPKMPGQQEGAVCYHCNNHYSDKTPFGDKDGNN